MARLGTVTRATRAFRLSHDAGDNRTPETTGRLVAKERRSLIRRPKGDGFEPPLLWSPDSKEVQAWLQITERSFRENIVSFHGRVPSIDWMQ